MYETKLPDIGQPLRIPKSRKPRVKELNDALISLGGGRMKSLKVHNRPRDKRDLHHILEDSKNDYRKTD